MTPRLAGLPNTVPLLLSSRFFVQLRMTPLRALSTLARTSLRLLPPRQLAPFQEPSFRLLSTMAAAAQSSTVKPSAQDLEVAKQFLAFNDGCSSVFHATYESQKRVEAAGAAALNAAE